MKNQAHSASFESLDKDAPENCGTKHLSSAFGRKSAASAPKILAKAA
jgi:hypothetical protein